MDNNLEKYSKLVKIRDILKGVQRLSWNITQLEKKFPIDKAEEIGYDELTKAYLDFDSEVQWIAHLLREELCDDEIKTKTKIKTKSNANKNNTH